MYKPALRQLLLVPEVENQFPGFGVTLQLNVSKFDSPQQSRIRMCPNSNYSWSFEPTILPCKSFGYYADEIEAANPLSARIFKVASYRIFL